MENNKNRDDNFTFKKIFFIVLKVVISLMIIYSIGYSILFLMGKYTVSQLWKDKPSFPFEVTKTSSNKIIKIEEKK